MRLSLSASLSWSGPEEGAGKIRGGMAWYGQSFRTLDGTSGKHEHHVPSLPFAVSTTFPFTVTTKVALTLKQFWERARAEPTIRLSGLLRRIR